LFFFFFAACVFFILKKKEKMKPQELALQGSKNCKTGIVRVQQINQDENAVSLGSKPRKMFRILWEDGREEWLYKTWAELFRLLEAQSERHFHNQHPQ
jgi:hypothetical protein